MGSRTLQRPTGTPRGVLEELWTGMDAGTAAMLATVVVWGPLDVVVTLAAWHLEANPLVIALGPTGWVVAKLAVVAGTVWVWHRAREWVEKAVLVDVWMVLLATLGAVLVGLNLAVLAGALG